MKILTLLVLILAVVSCNLVKQNLAEDAIQYKNIEKHVSTLSSDSFQGRMPTTPAEALTVDYLAREMEGMGLSPANNNSFFQEVPILSVRSVVSPTLDFDTPEGTLKFQKIKDYVAFSRKMEPEQSLIHSKLVFAGFGITAPEYNRDDFQGMDLKDKTVLVFVNDPGYGTDNSYFKGNTMTYYGRWTYKFEEAAHRGAKACFIIHEDGPAGYPWNVVQNSGETTKLYLKPENNYLDRCAFEGWISKKAAEQLFASCGFTLDDAKRQAVQPNFKPFELPVDVSGWMKSKFETSKSLNVCGMIKGTKRPDEVVVYTAHWDHLGIGIPVRGDSIYNGATDNAGAVAWLLEIANAFRIAPPTERSILFLAVTGEESGLLGSEYYTMHPFFPMNKTVACINSDAMLFFGKYRDVMLTGNGQSELDRWVEEAAKKHNRYIAPDPNPEKGMFFRSDQFPFVKLGVPAIYAKGYTDAVKFGKEETMKQVDLYWKEIYHTPFDEYHPENDDLEGVVDDAHLLYHVGYKLARSSKWPRWNHDSEFRKIREESRD